MFQKFTSCLLLFAWIKSWMYFSFTSYLCTCSRSKILILLLVVVTIKLTRWSANFNPSHFYFSFRIICGTVQCWRVFMAIFRIEKRLNGLQSSRTRLDRHAGPVCYSSSHVNTITFEQLLSKQFQSVRQRLEAQYNNRRTLIARWLRYSQATSRTLWCAISGPERVHFNDPWEFWAK